MKEEFLKMRKFLNKAIAAVLTTAMVVSVIAYAPATVKAEDVKLGTWTVMQAGSVPDNWGDYGDLSKFDGITFSNGQTVAATSLEEMKWVDSKAVGGLTYTGISADGFTTNILSNGWQANYNPYVSSLSENNPWTLRMDMEKVQLQSGYKYTVSFDASCIPATDSGYDCKYANVVVLDSDTNVYASQTIKITKDTKTFTFNIDVINQPVVTVQIFLGAFPIVKDPVEKEEVNWKGQLTVANMKFVNKGKSDKVSTVTIVNGTKKTSQLVEKNTVVEEPNPGTKAGYIFAGWYAGSSKYNFSKPVTGDVTITAKWTKVTKPAKAKITSLKSQKSKSITVTMKKATGVKGFKIQYSTSKNFKKGTKTVTTTASKKVVSKLKTGKTYYVRIKAYKVDSKNKKYESAKWSTAKKVVVR